MPVNVLTVDVGTQSLRACIVNKKGEIIAIERVKYERAYHSPLPGYAEQDPDVYWEALCTATRRLGAGNPELWKEITAMSVTTMRDTCVCVDEDGRPLRDAIVWLDQREADIGIEDFPLFSKIGFGLVGMSETVKTQRRITKSNWIRMNQPDIWEKTYKYLLISGYINYKLTGQFKDSAASLIGHIPFDSKTRGWMNKSSLLYPVFDIDKSRLCTVVESGGVIGTVSESAAQATGINPGTEVIATGSDKGCETLGSGVLRNDEVSLSFGTSATIQFSSDRYVEPLPFLPAYPAVAKGYFNPEIQIYRGYWMISWFKKEFAEKECVQAAAEKTEPEELLNRYLDSVPPGCEGLLLQPYWSPLLQNPEAKGSIIGFSDVHTRVHIYRAIIEGIGFALYEGMENISSRMKTRVRKVVVAGGGSRSDAICKITADMFGLPVYRLHTYEASSIGCALAVFVAKGEYKSYDEAAEGMVRYEKPFIPDDAVHGKYMRLYNDVYRKIYGRLHPLYKAMYAIRKK